MKLHEESKAFRATRVHIDPVVALPLKIDTARIWDDGAGVMSETENCNRSSRQFEDDAVT